MADNTEFIEFERGDKIKHPKWGLGTVLYKSGSAEKQKVIVLFQEVGQKTLAVKYANLEKIASAGRGKDKEKLEDIILAPEIPIIPGVAEPIEDEEAEAVIPGEEDEEEEEEL